MDVGTPAEGTAGGGTGVVALPAGAVRHATEPDLVLPPGLTAAGSLAVSLPVLPSKMNCST